MEGGHQEEQHITQGPGPPAIPVTDLDAAIAARTKKTKEPEKDVREPQHTQDTLNKRQFYQFKNSISCSQIKCPLLVIKRL